jgi:pimeloyl-ACP methyl ester carboxylesterase
VTTADGESLFVQDWGSGPVLVFVHGWSMSSAFWEYQTEALVRRGLRCVAYDQRGCGRSSPAMSGYDLDTLADDLEAVLASRGLRQVVLVSHSMGAAEVTRYLSRHGAGRIAKVVLVSCTTPTLGVADRLERIEQAMRADRPKYVRDLAVPFFEPEAASPALVDWGVGIVLQASLTACLGYNHANVTADLTHEMKAFTVPTLVVHGSADASAPLERTGARTAALIPGAKLIAYEGAGHGLPLTRAGRLNQDLVEFAIGQDPDFS